MSPRDLEALIARVAPDLDDVAVVYASAAPPALAAADEYLGVTVGTLDLVLGDLVPPGRRAVVLLNDRGIREDGGLTLDSDPADVLWTFGRTALHEAAHCLDRGAPYYIRATEASPRPEMPLAMLT